MTPVLFSALGHQKVNQYFNFSNIDFLNCIKGEVLIFCRIQKYLYLIHHIGLSFHLFSPSLQSRGLGGGCLLNVRLFLNSVKIILAAFSIFFSIISFRILNIRIQKLLMNSSRILSYSFDSSLSCISPSTSIASFFSTQ